MRNPDVEAIIHFLSESEGGRIMPVSSGYRPAHLVMDDYLTTGVHNYFGKETVMPGESVEGTITFITPEYYPNCLWEGKVINIQEGSKVVGFAEITKVLNENLRKKD